MSFLREIQTIAFAARDDYLWDSSAIMTEMLRLIRYKIVDAAIRGDLSVVVNIGDIIESIETTNIGADNLYDLVFEKKYADTDSVIVRVLESDMLAEFTVDYIEDEHQDLVRFSW